MRKRKTARQYKAYLFIYIQYTDDRHFLTNTFLSSGYTERICCTTAILSLNYIQSIVDVGKYKLTYANQNNRLAGNAALLLGKGTNTPVSREREDRVRKGGIYEVWRATKYLFQFALFILTFKTYKIPEWIRAVFSYFISFLFEIVKFLT